MEGGAGLLLFGATARGGPPPGAAAGTAGATAQGASPTEALPTEARTSRSGPSSASGAAAAAAAVPSGAALAAAGGVVVEVVDAALGGAAAGAAALDVVAGPARHPGPCFRQHLSASSRCHQLAPARAAALQLRMGPCRPASGGRCVVVTVLRGQPRLWRSQHHACFSRSQDRSHTARPSKQSYCVLGGAGAVTVVVAARQPSLKCSQHHASFSGDHSRAQCSTPAAQSKCGFAAAGGSASTRGTAGARLAASAPPPPPPQPLERCLQHHARSRAGHRRSSAARHS